jgi:hypothetical protein
VSICLSVCVSHPLFFTKKLMISLCSLSVYPSVDVNLSVHFPTEYWGSWYYFAVTVCLCIPPAKLLGDVWDHRALCVCVCPLFFFLSAVCSFRKNVDDQYFRERLVYNDSIVSYIFVAAGNLFTESLPSNERLLRLRYSGFQASYYNIVMKFSCGTPGFHGTRFGNNAVRQPSRF